MPYIIFDIAIVLILLFFLWRGYAKGFVLTLCSLAAVFVALIGASLLSDFLAEPVAKTIEPIVTGSIHDTVTSYYQRSTTESTSKEEDDWLDQLPLDKLLDPMRESKFFKGYVEAFQKTVDDKTTGIVTHAVESMAHFVAVRIARTVIFVFAFFAVLFAWVFLSRALDLVAKLPVLSTLNRWGGAAVGLIRGALVLFIAAWLLRNSCISQEAVERTILLRLLCTSSPLSFFL